ncbi:HD domain-containing protein [Candidatus Saccharibacteria bacterium]|nr:HD domain-containing protein [Candidatus Saccharibacteria bacterium]
MGKLKNKTLTPYFKGATLMSCWNGSITDLVRPGIPEQVPCLLQEICTRVPDSIADAYEFLSSLDLLVQYIYGDGAEQDVDDELFLTFPFIDGAEIPDDVEMVRGYIGTQVSKYHAETLHQHVALVAANLVNHGVDEKLAALLAVFHDVGKKYTGATNKVGEMCFYGHAELSAFIAGHWLREMRSYQVARRLTAVIYGHMLPLTAWNKGKTPWSEFTGPQLKKMFREELETLLGAKREVDMVMRLIDTFSKCDEGLRLFHEESLAKIARGEQLIAKFS